MTIIFASIYFFNSCTSGKITNEAVLDGFWITEEGRSGEIYFDVMYSALSFKNDSFFLEVGRVRDKNNSHNPFRAKGIYQIEEEYLVLKGSVKYESGNKYNEGYSQTFEYSFSENILIIQSLNNRHIQRFVLKKMSNSPKTF